MSNAPEEVSLQDIDALLDSVDPGFNKSLDEVRDVQVDPNVVIEATIMDDGLGGDEIIVQPSEPEPSTRLGKLRAYLRARRSAAWAWFKAKLWQGLLATIIFLKTRPLEALRYSLVVARAAIQQGLRPIRWFAQASSAQKIMTITLLATLGAGVYLLKANLRGVWLPQLFHSEVTSLEHMASQIYTYDPSEPGLSFYVAFPQERHDFLFGRMKVNLRPTEENPNPMGAFEIIVQVDSQDTAVETRDREVEFSDALQRVLEEEKVTDLATELGKVRLKTRIKRALNQKLTQGWVKDVSFKTFILKP